MASRQVVKKVPPELTKKRKSRSANADGDDEGVDGGVEPVDRQQQQRRRTSSAASAASRSPVDRLPLGDYLPGSIVRIKMENFVTYDDCEFCPGPRLNVVLGPNGTGKSSIVCAMALGLGGNTALLGRAKDVGQFVKHGAQKGFCEIELKGRAGQPNVVIRRTITTGSDQSAQSDWHIDGKRTTHTKVKETVADFNIQVDNLCQFLPQDRVVEFARLSGQELLRETEKAAGAADMLGLHDKLIELHKLHKTLGATYEKHKAALEDLERQQQVVQRDVLRFQEREKNLQQVRLMELKRPWLHVTQQTEITRALKEEVTKADEDVKAFQKQHAPIQRALAQAEKDANELAARCNAVGEQLKVLDRKRRGNSDLFNQLTGEVESTQAELNNLHARAADRKKSADLLRNKIAQMQRELAAMPSKSSIEEQLKPLMRELNEAKNSRNRLDNENADVDREFRAANAEHVKTKNRLEELKNVKLRRLEQLQHTQPQVYECYTWIQENKQLFKQEVYGPLVLEIDVPEQHAALLEQTIPAWTRLAFIFQNQADATVLQKEFNERRRVKITSSALVETLNEKSPLDIAKLRPYGVYAWLDDLYNAPPPVKEWIRQNSGTHLVAVASAAADAPENTRSIQEIMKAPSRFITPNSMYSLKQSSYGSRDKFTSVDPVKKPKALSAGVDEAKKAQLERELLQHADRLESVRRRKEELKQTERTVLNTINQLEQQKKAFEGQLKERAKLEMNIRGDQGQLQIVEQHDDTAEEQAQLERKLKKLTDRRVANAKELCEVMGKLTETMVALNSDIIKREQAKITLQDLKAQDHEFVAQLKQLEANQQQVKARFQTARDKLKDLRQEAEAKAPLTEELNNQFKELPDTLEDLETLIHQAKARADLNYINNPQVIQDFEARKVQIDELQGKLHDEQGEFEAQAGRIEQIKSDWLPRLRQLIANINVKFSKHFADIGCQGEVALKEDDADFAQWSIELRVKFRSIESLHRLTAKMQSGGERSVSTMLYLISLQDLTPCPFRLVDEINQAMDQKNERNIFEVVAKTACQPGLPQYFLITPKLLPNLTFTDLMTILSINNGSGQLKHDEWQLDEWLEILQRRKENSAQH